MRMSDTVNVKETSETMRGLEGEESNATPGGHSRPKSESRERMEADGDRSGAGGGKRGNRGRETDGGPAEPKRCPFYKKIPG